MFYVGDDLGLHDMTSTQKTVKMRQSQVRLEYKGLALTFIHIDSLGHNRCVMMPNEIQYVHNLLAVGRWTDNQRCRRRFGISEVTWSNGFFEGSYGDVWDIVLLSGNRRVTLHYNKPPTNPASLLHLTLFTEEVQHSNFISNLSQVPYSKIDVEYNSDNITDRIRMFF